MAGPAYTFGESMSVVVLVPEAVPLAGVLELVGDDAGEGRPNHPAGHGPLSHSPREQVDVIHVSARQARQARQSASRADYLTNSCLT